MNCPSCNTTLTMSERSGVEIDYCPQCRGVWLDRGELDKIIERAAALEGRRGDDRRDEYEYRYEREPKKPYPERRFDEDYDKHKKHRRKSFLGDLFDFD